MKADPDVQTPAQYIAGLPEERRTAVVAIDKAIRKAAPTLEPHVSSGMLGYGRYHYKYASGREGDAAVVGLASQKNHLSMYMCVTENGKHLPEANATRLGKVSVGKGCIRFKKLEDLDLPVAMELVKQAEQMLKDGLEFTC